MSIKELAEQAGFEAGEQYTVLGFDNYAEYSPCYQLKNLADLIRADERNKCAQDYLQDCADAVEAARVEEREACAKLCESMGVYPELNVYGGGPDWYKRQKECATAIRQRGEK